MACIRAESEKIGSAVDGVDHLRPKAHPESGGRIVARAAPGQDGRHRARQDEGDAERERGDGKIEPDDDGAQGGRTGGDGHAEAGCAGRGPAACRRRRWRG